MKSRFMIDMCDTCKLLRKKTKETMPKNYYYDMSIFKQWFERKRRQKIGKFKR